MDWVARRRDSKTGGTEAQKDSALPFCLVIVVKQLEDAGQDPHLGAIREFCAQQGVRVETRRYEASHRHDRDEVGELPALHLYKRKALLTTFYPNRRPVDVIANHLRAWRQSQHEKRKTREALLRPLLAIRAFCARLVRGRMTRMEKLEDERKAYEKRQQQRRNSSF